jgi:hypothetical protein
MQACRQRDAFKRTGITKCGVLGTTGLSTRLIAARPRRVHPKLTPPFGDRTVSARVADELDSLTSL